MTDEGLASALHKLGIPIQMKKGGSYEYSSLTQIPPNQNILKPNNNHDSQLSSCRTGFDISAKRSLCGNSSLNGSVYGGSKAAQKQVKKDIANREHNELIKNVNIIFQDSIKESNDEHEKRLLKKSLDWLNLNQFKVLTMN